MPQGAILPDHYLAVHYQALSVKQSEVFTDPDIPGYLNAKKPFDKDPVKDQIGDTQIEIDPAG